MCCKHKTNINRRWSNKFKYYPFTRPIKKRYRKSLAFETEIVDCCFKQDAIHLTQFVDDFEVTWTRNIITDTIWQSKHPTFSRIDFYYKNNWYWNSIHFPSHHSVFQYSPPRTNESLHISYMTDCMSFGLIGHKTDIHSATEMIATDAYFSQYPFPSSCT